MNGWKDQVYDIVPIEPGFGTAFDKALTRIIDSYPFGIEYGFEEDGRSIKLSTELNLEALFPRVEKAIMRYQKKAQVSVPCKLGTQPAAILVGSWQKFKKGAKFYFRTQDGGQIFMGVVDNENPLRVSYV